MQQHFVTIVQYETAKSIIDLGSHLNLLGFFSQYALITEYRLIYPLLNLNLIASASSEASQPTFCLAKYVIDGVIINAFDEDKNYCSDYRDPTPWLKFDMQERFSVHSVRGIFPGHLHLNFTFTYIIDVAICC